MSQLFSVSCCLFKFNRLLPLKFWLIFYFFQGGGVPTNGLSNNSNHPQCTVTGKSLAGMKLRRFLRKKASGFFVNPSWQSIIICILTWQGSPVGRSSSPIDMVGSPRNSSSSPNQSPGSGAYDAGIKVASGSFGTQNELTNEFQQKFTMVRSAKNFLQTKPLHVICGYGLPTPYRDLMRNILFSFTFFFFK